MDKREVIVAILFLGFLLGLGVYIQHISDMKNEQPKNELANPASKYCAEQGYNLTIRTNSDGSQTGYCIFPNGKECEEWLFFRGECKNA